ncbi:sugar phosphate isomerase [Paenibacillus baekrokdamisoli]|uniref:Sugar phosphate isomerase n=1 Tax=Paenibacillus baekrokdamisoli TaxID=1712516 RepID=A0A3G9JFI0_9BACL|nr:sugar phosphate isomerase/epimerase [Paenibacillus baekrokdamisoli]MBB3071302.1 sugar phosphate isomerase/epimerase [Paenibacillus baekrokdamisoli]BBH24661.1 sugar phosphate isomerase [Paenibacillus baekrokdamisoli]
MRRNQIAAQLYTLRDFAHTAEELDAALKKVRAIGYDAVQVSGIGPIPYAEVKEICGAHQLKICATHISFDRLVNELDSVIEQHLAWNCRYVGLGGLPVEYRTGKAGYTAMGKLLTEIGSKLTEAGLQLIYHNHKFEFEKFEGKTGMDWLLESSDPEHVGFELDTYWVQAGGADPVEWIRKVEGRMKVIHLKDMAIVNDNQVFSEIGAGNMNFPAIIEACRDTGVQWYVVEQDECAGDPFESLAISYRYLSKMANDREESEANVIH